MSDQTQTTALFDVIAINIRTGAHRMIAERKSEEVAEGIIRMAVGRRGVENEIFKPVPAGTIKEPAP